ncbi:VanZ family protein [Blastococcus sp. SYSU D00813]
MTPRRTHATGVPQVPGAALASAALPVVLVTLSPAGAGWTWADPVTELHWYLSGLGSPSVVLQLVGNVLLLAPLAVLAVLRRPVLRRPVPLAAAALAAGTAVELLQWALPLGRVVSPVDALLNAAGAVAGGLLAAAVTAPRVGGLPDGNRG